MTVHIEGQLMNWSFSQALKGVEDLLIGPLDEWEKWLFLYDIAMRNRAIYQCEGAIVHQRELWISFLTIPQSWDFGRGQAIMIGPKGRGISEIRGDTNCTVYVGEKEEPRPYICISGESLEDVKECRERAKSRINWAKERYSLRR